MKTNDACCNKHDALWVCKKKEYIIYIDKRSEKDIYNLQKKN